MTQQSNQQNETTDDLEYDPATVEPACQMEPVDYLVMYVAIVGGIIALIVSNSGCAG